MTTDERVTPGAVLGGYQLMGLAGRGGMGKVYRARDERLGRDVALKVLFGKAAADPAFRARLVRESRLAASLDHPNVVPVYDAGEADGHVFIAMRFVDGTDLGTELRHGLMSLERALSVARAGCSGPRRRPRAGLGTRRRQTLQRAGGSTRALLPDRLRT